MTELGRLDPVDLRKAWDNEARNFTPWIASVDGSQLLGDALQMELEVVKTEVPVGDYKADILCEDASNGSKVVIENQLTESDHDHAAKMVTYAAGLEASTVVWIAKEFRSEHRKLLAWLNQSTNSDIRFFGVVIELLRIGDSTKAPRFTVVSYPDAWPKRGKGAPPNTTGQEHTLFWTKFGEFMKTADTLLKPGNPSPVHYMDFYFGIGTANISAVRLKSQGSIRVQFVLKGDSHRTYLSALEAQRIDIEGEIGARLDWRPREVRSSVDLTVDMDPSDASDWEGQMNWFLGVLERFHEHLPHRLRSLVASNSAAVSLSPPDDDA